MCSFDGLPNSREIHGAQDGPTRPRTAAAEQRPTRRGWEVEHGPTWKCEQLVWKMSFLYLGVCKCLDDPRPTKEGASFAISWVGRHLVRTLDFLTMAGWLLHGSSMSLDESEAIILYVTMMLEKKSDPALDSPW